MGHDPFSRICRNFSLKLNGSDQAKLKSFEEAGPPFEVDHSSRIDWSDQN